MSNSTSRATNVTPTSTQASSPTSTSSNIPPTSSTANTSPTVAPSTSSFSTSSFSSPPTSSQSTTSEPPSTTSTPTSKTPTSTSTTSSAPPTTSPSEILSTSVITQSPTDGGSPSLSTVIITSTAPPATTGNTGSSTSSSAGSTGTAGLVDVPKSSNGGGLNGGGKIAVAVVVPIVAVALIVLAGLFLWRKRKQRKDAEELRRKEVEEYGYNPNNDPTLPAVGSASGDGPFEMREDGSSGYRGWGTTAVASSGRKASTTLSGPSAGGIGMAYSEGTSPTHGPVSETRSDNPLMDGRSPSTEAEALGAMGPAASGNRSGDINRGPSNASSSYSAANRSDGSGEAGIGGGQYYNNQYDAGNPYNGEAAYGSPPGRAEVSGQPVIRDVQARRNTRIENPSHFPQQSAGIAQNF